MVSFYPCAAVITYHSEEPAVSPFYLKIKIDYHHNQDWAVTFIANVCSAVMSALLSVVENLELQLMATLHKYQLDLGLFSQRAHWHAFLRSFGAVKTPILDTHLAYELSNMLRQNNEAVIDKLLPILSRLVVITVLEKEVVYRYFSSFMKARHLSGYSIDLQVIISRHFSLSPPSISWPFDTFRDEY
jgi:hypothetical protein